MADILLAAMVKKGSRNVVVVGAGLAGLNCAMHLEKAGMDVVLLEAADAPGGRVRTDLVDGFRLDRGFQVLLTAYSEAQLALDYDALKLKALKPGAMVWHSGRFHRFADPFREPMASLALLADPIVPLGDKLRVARLRARVRSGKDADLFTHPDASTRSFLQDYGFSERMIDRFFSPFFGGVFLEKELVTSSRFFEYLFRMFSSGETTVPELGMGEIPRQMAAKLKGGTLSTNARVKGLSRGKKSWSVAVEARPILEASAVVLAVDELQAKLLLSSLVGSRSAERLNSACVWNSTTTFYYASQQAPVSEPIILLNGAGRQAGPVNNFAVISQVSRAYAPAGAELMTASVVGEAPADDAGMTSLEADVRRHMESWFPGQTAKWQLLGAYPIQHALPQQRSAAWLESATSIAAAGDRIYLCGDYRETASIQGSLASGRRAAEAVLAAMS